MLNVNN